VGTGGVTMESGKRLGSFSLERLHFLVVDDNKHMRALVKSILYALGCKDVLEAGDGADAFRELRHYAADIIIADWNMQPLDGIDFVRLVRTGKDSPNPYVPIIMLTGHTELHRVQEARDAGVHEFLAKPISAKALYSRIRSIVERPRSFIRTRTYFGPDRRRKQVEYKGKERRKDRQQARVVDEPKAPRPEPRQEEAPLADEADAGLSQDEVEALLGG